MKDKEYIRLLEIIADNVKKMREGKNLSQFDLALKADCSRNQISRIENQDVNPSIFLLSKIASALETTVLKLLSKE